MRRRPQPQAADEPAALAQQEVPGFAVAAVEIGIGRALLDGILVGCMNIVDDHVPGREALAARIGAVIGGAFDHPAARLQAALAGDVQRRRGGGLREGGLKHEREHRCRDGCELRCHCVRFRYA